MSLLFLIVALLMGVGQPAHAQEATIEGTVTGASEGEPLVGVNLRIAGTNEGTATDAEGRYSLPVEPSSVTLQATYTGYESTEKTVEVSGGETVTLDFTLETSMVNMDDVVVVGSRGVQRTAIESPTPKDVVSNSELEAAGTVETAQMLQKMVPSMDFPREAMGDGTETVRPIRFRGLGPDQVLVLVNGKRRHKAAIETGGHSAGVDLNALPANAIERVEVLRDGASAQYGSDAVAGVVNVILKEDVGTDLSFKSGLYGEGDGKTFNLTLDHGFQIGDEGFFRISSQARYRGLVNRTGPDQRQQYWGTTVDEEAPVVSDDKTGEEVDDFFEDVVPDDGRDTTFYAPEQDRLNEIWQENPERTFKMGKPEKVDGGAFFNSQIPIESTNATAYTFGGVTRKHSRSGCFPRLPIQSTRYNVQYPSGFTPMYVNNSTDASGAVGLRGTGENWSWDVSSKYGGNFFERNMDDTHNATYQQYSPTYMKVGTKNSQEIINNVDVTRTVETDALSSLNVSVGGEMRFENYQIGAGEPKSYLDGGMDIPTGPDQGDQPSVGNQCFPGFTPSDEVDTWRQNAGAYLDVTSDITETFMVSSAVRFENYSDFGSTLTYKVASRWEFVDGFAIRGSANTGFKAPALLQSNFSSTQTGFEDVDGDGFQEGIDIRTFPLDSRAAQALGAPALEPETSINFSGGVTAEPTENLSLTIDGYDIRVSDRITSSSTFIRSENPAIDELFSQFPELDNLNAGSFFANAIDTRAYGIDAVLSYATNLGSYGQLRLTSSYNWREREVESVNQNPTELENLNADLCDRLCQLEFEEALPQSSLSAMVNYQVSGLQLMLRGWRPGEQVSPTTNDVDDDGTEEVIRLDHYNRVPPTFLMDAEVAYEFEQGLTLGVGANNVFDTRPPRNKTVTHRGQTFDNSYSGNWPYVNQFDNAYGTAGGFYYARVKYEF